MNRTFWFSLHVLNLGAWGVLLGLALGDGSAAWAAVATLAMATSAVFIATHWYLRGVGS